MANVQIPNLPAAIALNGSEQVEVVQSGTSVRVTTSQIAALQTGPIGPSGPQGPTGPTGPTGTGGALGLFGSFFDITDQTGSLIPKAINIGSVSAQNGVTLSNGSRVNFSVTGTYSITFSLQLVNTDNNVINTADVWLKKNGVVIPDTNSKFDVPGRHSSDDGAIIGTVNFVLQLNAGDYIEMFWAVNNTQVSIDTIPASGSIPRTPGVIFTATQVTYTQVGLYTFDTVSALLANTSLTYSSIAMGQLLYVSNGWYIYSVASSSATNNQLVTAGGLKLYVLPGASGYNVRAFGATGDGVTDDTVAVHKAFDCVRANKGAVYFPVGTYRVTSGYTQSTGGTDIHIRGDVRSTTGGASYIKLDSTDPASFFYSSTATYNTLQVTDMSFSCNQFVQDRAFFKIGGNTWQFFTRVNFEAVERPIVWLDGAYWQSSAYRDVQFRNSGTFHSEATTLIGTLLVLDNINHELTVPVNTEKIVCNFTGVRRIEATNFLLEGTSPGAGWTIVKLSDGDFTAADLGYSLATFNGFWIEFVGSTYDYSVVQKRGLVVINSTNTAAIYANSKYRLEENAILELNGASLADSADPSTVFEMDNSDCSVVINNSGVRNPNQLVQQRIYYRDCYKILATNSTWMSRFSNSAAELLYAYNGTPFDPALISSGAFGGSFFRNETDATYGRKLSLYPSSNTFDAFIRATSFNSFSVGDEFFFKIRAKLPTFTGTAIQINPSRNGATIATNTFDSATYSGQIVTLTCPFRLTAAATSVGLNFGTVSVTSMTDPVEIYHLEIYRGGVFTNTYRTGYPSNVQFYATAAPVNGTWAAGDRAINSAPAIGQPKSWVCTVAGTPGTWVSEGNL